MAEMQLGYKPPLRFDWWRKCKSDLCSAIKRSGMDCGYNNNPCSARQPAINRTPEKRIQLAQTKNSMLVNMHTSDGTYLPITLTHRQIGCKANRVCSIGKNA